MSSKFLHNVNNLLWLHTFFSPSHSWYFSPQSSWKYINWNSNYIYYHANLKVLFIWISFTRTGIRPSERHFFSCINTEFGSNGSFEKYVGKMDGTTPRKKIIKSFSLRNSPLKYFEIRLKFPCIYNFFLHYKVKF